MSAITTFYLVRHGEADVGTGPQLRMIGRTDVPLTVRGQMQARALALKLQREPAYQAVYSSPAQRALETARMLVSPATPIAVDERLREIDCGVTDGLLVSEVQELFAVHWDRNQRQIDPEFRWPEGESYREFRNRCLESFETMVNAHRNSIVLVVTHAGVITQILNHIYGNGPAAWSAHRVDNASLTVLHWGAKSLEVALFNETAMETSVSHSL